MAGRLTERADRFVRGVFKRPEENAEQPKASSQRETLQRLRRRRDRMQRVRKVV